MTEQERTTRRLYELPRSVRESIFEFTFGEPSDEVSVKLDHFLELEEDPDAWVGENLVKAFGHKRIYWYFLISERKFHVGQMLAEHHRQGRILLGLDPWEPLVPIEIPKHDARVDALIYARHCYQPRIEQSGPTLEDMISWVNDEPTEEDEE